MRKMGPAPFQFRRLAALFVSLVLLSACFGTRSVPEPAPSAPAPSVAPEPKPAPIPSPDGEPVPEEELPPRGWTDYQPEIPDASSKLQEMKLRNPDTVGWLTVPGTGIDEPVFQTYDNSFYLFHDEQMNYRQSGSLFVDYECTLADGEGRNFSQNTIIYGHNLGNPKGVRDDPEGERFAKLLKFTDFAFADAHPYIYLTTGKGPQTYEIFAVSYIDTQPEPVSYIYPEYAPMAFSLLLDDIRERSLYDYNIPVGTEDQILTLSCCTHKYGTEKENPYQRFVIMARLMPENWPFYPNAGILHNTDRKEPDFTKYTTEITPEERIAQINWKHLTAEQKLEDFDLLVQTLRENYPYYGLLRRMDYDLEAKFRQARPLVEQTKSDAEFYELLRNLLPGNPYLESEPWNYPEILEKLKQDAEAADPGEPSRKLLEVYSDPEVREAYEQLSEPYGLMQTYRDVYIQIKAEETRHQYPGPQHPESDKPKLSDFAEPGETIELQGTKNIEAALLRPGEIAYVRVRDFNRDFLEEDREFLTEFYHRAADYDHVIFDFTENAGNDTKYFDELIAAPNIETPLTARYTELMKNGEQNRSFYALENGGWERLSAPKLPNINVGDLAGLRWMREREIRIEPSGKKTLSGKLWFLVDKSSGWAAQYAATVAKNSGFAALAGEQPHGMGLGGEPLAVVLPNSKFIIRYSANYVADPGGVCAQEFGVEPDFPAAEGESALEACLRAIGSLAK